MINPRLFHKFPKKVFGVQPCSIAEKAALSDFGFVHPRKTKFTSEMKGLYLRGF